MTSLERGVEGAARTCAHSLELCAQAEGVACALLARHDPYGRTHWDALRRAHLLDRLARARASAARQGAPGSSASA